VKVWLKPTFLCPSCWGQMAIAHGEGKVPVVELWCETPACAMYKREGKAILETKDVDEAARG